jgi:CRISPR/Cas system CMR-associated protein Cmr5 small subunit
VSDSWRSIIGSAGLSVVNAFFESKEDTMTDEEWKTMAADGLENLKFLYSNTEFANSKVHFILYSDAC